MRGFSKIVLAAMMAALLSGCNTTTEAEYKLGISVIKKDPALRQDLSRECIADAKKLTLNEQKTLSAIMNVSLQQFPRSICNRIIGAMLNGRLSYSEAKNFGNPNSDMSKLIRIIQGK
jgi:hypothetical protein